MRNTPTELVLLEIAQGLQTLSKSTDLSKVITDAYGLKDSEIAKANDARAVIAKSDLFLADLKAKQDALADINERISVAQALDAKNKATQDDIAKRQGDLTIQAKKNADDAKANDTRSGALDKRERDVTARETAIKTTETDIQNTKADLKRRSAALTEGL